jgi:hypothetical protein
MAVQATAGTPRPFLRRPDGQNLKIKLQIYRFKINNNQGKIK